MKRSKMKFFGIFAHIYMMALFFLSSIMGAAETPIGDEITMYTADMVDSNPSDDCIDPVWINGGCWANYSKKKIFIWKLLKDSLFACNFC